MERGQHQRAESVADILYQRTVADSGNYCGYTEHTSSVGVVVSEKDDKHFSDS